MNKIAYPAAALLLTTATAALLSSPASAMPAACANRVNNNIDKLTECVTLDGVRAHQQALQDIADANFGIRTSGTAGYDASVDYVVETLQAAGYEVTRQPFTFNAFIELTPPVLDVIAPIAISYVPGVDIGIFDQSDAGDVTADVVAVDLDLGLGNTSTSGCEAADFAGFPVGAIALLQRGACNFSVKAENAAAAGAVGAIIFNQGNTEDRQGLISGTLGNEYSGGIPVLEATYAVGETLAGLPGATVNLAANVFRGEATTENVLAELPGRNDDNVVMVGAHLNSVNEGPGINDNGSGSAAILEVAVQMAKVKPRNTVRFAWWGAEESGLVGSDYYVLEF